MGLPAGLDGVASSRGTHRRLWGLGGGGTFSPETRIFQSQQRLWGVCVGSLVSAWGACRLGVSPTWFSVNCSPGFGFHNLETLPSAARVSSRARNRMSVADDILPTSAHHLADQGLARLELLVFLSAPRFQEGRTEVLLPLGPRPITPTSHLKTHLQVRLSPRCPGFFQLCPQAPLVSLQWEPSSDAPNPTCWVQSSPQQPQIPLKASEHRRPSCWEPPRAAPHSPSPVPGLPCGVATAPWSALLGTQSEAALTPRRQNSSQASPGPRGCHRGSLSGCLRPLPPRPGWTPDGQTPSLCPCSAPVLGMSRLTWRFTS